MSTTWHTLVRCALNERQPCVLHALTCTVASEVFLKRALLCSFAPARHASNEQHLSTCGLQGASSVQHELTLLMLHAARLED